MNELTEIKTRELKARIKLLTHSINHLETFALTGIYVSGEVITAQEIEILLPILKENRTELLSALNSYLELYPETN